MESNVPFYSVGKKAKDLFIADFGAGDVRVTTRAQLKGLQLQLRGRHETQKSDAELCAKYNFKKHGIVWTESLNLKQELVSEVEMADNIVKGLKVFGRATVASKPLATIVGYELRKHGVHHRASLDLSRDPTFSGQLTYTLGGLTAGCDGTFRNGVFTRSALVCGYSDKQCAAVAHYAEHSGLTGYARLSLNANMDVGMQYQAKQRLWGAVASYQHGDIGVRLKVDATQQLTALCTYRIDKRVKLMCNAALDSRGLRKDSLSFGLSADLDAK